MLLLGVNQQYGTTSKIDHIGLIKGQLFSCRNVVGLSILF